METGTDNGKLSQREWRDKLDKRMDRYEDAHNECRQCVQENMTEIKVELAGLKERVRLRVAVWGVFGGGLAYLLDKAAPFFRGIL